MSEARVGSLLQAWYKWKSLRLPWRKRFLVGLDLQGNTYWEFRLSRADESLPNQGGRWRRIVKYPRSTHYSEIRVSPQWHQWLRYQRESPPSVREQHEDVARTRRMQMLAREADARWAAKPSLLDMPETKKIGLDEKRAPEPMTESATNTSRIREEPAREELREQIVQGEEEDGKGKGKDVKESTRDDDPWKRASRGGPSETWQPAAWTPAPSTRRR